jgi:hypothetical protein
LSITFVHALIGFLLLKKCGIAFGDCYRQKKTQIRRRICVSVNHLSNLGIYQEVPANDSRGIYCSHHHTVGIYLLFYLLPYCGSQDRLFRLRPAKQLLFPYKSPFRRSAALQLYFTGSELNFLQPSWYLP